MGKRLSSDSARAGSQKQQKEASRRAAPDTRERILPAPAKRLGPIISTVHTNDSTLTRSKGLLVSPFSELFLDRQDPVEHWAIPQLKAEIESKES